MSGSGGICHSLKRRLAAGAGFAGLDCGWNGVGQGPGVRQLDFQSHPGALTLYFARFSLFMAINAACTYDLLPLGRAGGGRVEQRWGLPVGRDASPGMQG